MNAVSKSAQIAPSIAVLNLLFFQVGLRLALIQRGEIFKSSTQKAVLPYFLWIFLFFDAQQWKTIKIFIFFLFFYFKF